MRKAPGCVKGYCVTRKREAAEYKAKTRTINLLQRDLNICKNNKKVIMS